MKHTLQLALTLFFATSLINLYAQTGKIKGTIKTSDNNPAAFVNIILENTNKGTTTDEQGAFLIDNVKEGSYTLVTSYVGLKSVRRSVNVNANQTTTLPEITLEVNQAELQEVIINSDRSNDYMVQVPSRSLRLQRRLLEVPQNIQVITRDLIQNQQAIDMLESVSRNVSGAQMIEHWGSFARINMRGFKIPAFRNGMNVELPWGPLTEDMSMVERIEFVKGPAGFMLSSGEPGGLYNVVTKKPTRYQQNEVTLTTGSFNTLRSTLDFGGSLDKNKNILYRVNLMGLTKGSHRDYEFNNRYTISPSVTYQINNNTSVTADYIYQYSQMSLIGAAYVFSANGFADLPRDFTLAEPNIDPSNISEHNLFIDLNHQLSDNWQLTAKIGYLNYNQMGTSLWINGVDTDGNIERTLSSFDAYNESKLGQLFLNGQFQTGNLNHQILTGVDMGQKDYYADWWQGGVIGRNIPFNIYNPQYGVPADSLPNFDRSESIRQRATNGSYPAIQGQRYSSLYLQDRISLFQDRARLTLGGRYTSFNGWSYGSSTDDQVITPRLGLNVTVFRNTSLYGLYDQSFLPQSGTTVDGEAFVPVRANNLEAGIKREWGNGQWSTTLSFYQITKENIVVGHPDPDVLSENPFAQIQLGEVVSKGFEFDIQGEITPGLKLILNYANTNVEITEDTDESLVGTRVAGHARHMANSWLSYQFSDNFLHGFGLSLGSQYQVDRSSWNWGADNESILPDYFRLDGAVSYRLRDINLSLNVYNILDEYLYSGSAYSTFYYWQVEPGINFRLNVGYTF